MRYHWPRRKPVFTNRVKNALPGRCYRTTTPKKPVGKKYKRLSDPGPLLPHRLHPARRYRSRVKTAPIQASQQTSTHATKKATLVTIEAVPRPLQIPPQSSSPLTNLCNPRQNGSYTVTTPRRPRFHPPAFPASYSRSSLLTCGVATAAQISSKLFTCPTRCAKGTLTHRSRNKKNLKYWVIASNSPKCVSGPQ